MTWGQLRLQLQIGAGISHDLLDEFLNARYEQVLTATEWSGLKYHGTIQTQAAYQSTTDTVTLTVGSTAVAGVGTAWTSAITGQRIYRPGDTAYYTATYVGATSLTLDRAFEGNGIDAAGTVYSASAYVFMQHIYALPSDARSPVTILDPVTGSPMGELSKVELDASAGPRTLVGDPKVFAPYDDSAETTLPVVHQVEFYPPPLRARGFPISYVHAAVGFNGSNTTAGPLPWVTMSVLLHGCRADIQVHLAAQSAAAGESGAASAHMMVAKGHEGKFQEELARMLKVEYCERRKKTPMKMADRFTRHRGERAIRGYGRGWGPGQGGPN